jgi:hypothetical protein
MGVIAPDNRFVFIHVPKTAGLSITQALAGAGQKFQQRPGLVAAAAEKDGIQFADHIRARDVAAYLGADAWRAAYSFGFVRNPWDRMVSGFHYILQNPAHGRYGEVSKMTFDQYLRARDRGELPFRPMWEWLSDGDGNQIVSEVFRYEDLREEYPHIVRSCGIEDPPPLPVLNASKHGDYRDYYSSELADIVRRRFSREIALFGYRF